MDREAANAGLRAARVEGDGEQRVCGFRLRVCDPLVVGPAQEVRIFEIARAAGVCARGQGYDPRAPGGDEGRPQASRELEMAQVVGRELRLETSPVAGEGRR